MAIAAMGACAISLGAAGTASAQDSVPASKTIAIEGANKGKDFKGTYTIERFAKVGNKLYAVGTLKGTLKNRKVTRRDVRIPAAVTAAEGAGASQAACDILHLTLGPLDLNLLGLRVQLNQVNLDITAVPGAGNLLGNLLCALTGLLDSGGLLGQLTGALQDLADALNAILALLPQSPAAAAAATAGR